MSTLRPELPDVPMRLQKLPVFRGYPVPYFVEWVNGEPEFRAMDHRKWMQCVRERLCWVCGEPIGKYLAFVIGPMCALNRVSGEPPCHRECAEWSARACPFLSMPKAKRRTDRLPDTIESGEAALKRNPGVAMVWVNCSYTIIEAGAAAAAGYLCQVGDPEEVLFYCEGRKATRDEVMHSIDTGLPSLREAAKLEAQYENEALAQIAEKYEEAKQLVAEYAA